jgi:hypothetical protein
MARRGRSVETDTDSVEFPGLERWRGHVDEKLQNVETGIVRVEQGIANMTKTITDVIKESDRCGRREHTEFEKRIAALELAHNYVRAKVAIFAGLAGLVGGGLSSAAWGAVFHKMLGY